MDEEDFFVTKKERRAHWEEQVAAFQASGLSVTEWCAIHDIKPHRLWYWIRNLSQAPPNAKTSSSPVWLSVEAGDPMEIPDATLSIRVGDAIIELKSGFDPVYSRMSFVPCERYAKRNPC
jgi:transposase-like protein